jgi:hypothetical protein
VGQVYDGERFAKGGFRMHELFFHDGTCPSDTILHSFLRIAEEEPGVALSSNEDICPDHVREWLHIYMGPDQALIKRRYLH